MRNSWLRGMLLGVSVVLLFTSGVALAQGPVCREGVTALGHYEEFGPGWSDHWTDEDNARGLEYT